MLVPLRTDFDADGLRAMARKTKDGPQARRLLALAAIYDGGSRTEAARIGGVTLQIVRDWVDSGGRRNTSREGVAMGVGKRRSDRAVRAVLRRSPGRPGVARREHRRRFWAAIAAGLPSEDAAAGVGVSPAVGARWFREAGGMPPSTL